MATSAPALDEIDALRTVDTAIQGVTPDARARIIRWIAERYSFALSDSVPTLQATPISPVAAPASFGVTPPADIRSFVEQKSPKNDVQFATVVAYYFQFEAPVRKPAITPEDLRNAYRQAGRKRPGQPGFTLNNAVRAGLLDRAGRGEFKVNNVGENLVAIAMPSEGTIGASQPRRRKTAAKRRAARGKAK